MGGSSQILKNIMAKEIENSKKESTSKKLIQYNKIELSALSRKTFINKEQLGHHFFGD